MKLKFADKKGLKQLFDCLKKKLSKYKVSQREFSQYVLNSSEKSFQRLLYMDTKGPINLVYVNAIYGWLNDDDRLEKLNETKQSGEFFYLSADNIDKNVLKFFHNSAN